MTELFRNSSQGALTRAQAVEREKARVKAERAAHRRMAEELARQGRGEDTEIAHVARGELVIPEALQSAELLNALHRVAADAGVPLDRLRVGEIGNSINPATGMPEFFDPWATKGSDFYCDRGAVSDGSVANHCEGWQPNFLKDKPGRYMPTDDDLVRLPDAQKEHYARYYEGTGRAEDMVEKGLDAVGGLFGPVGKPVVRSIGKFLGVDGASREEIAARYRSGISSPKLRP